ncbi:MAG: DUF4114 domain-containing protein [Rivularia sp. (in: Bacteria)]|nr:DUF4114 domain-containing protein [Rivularia sp. MS3]
MTTNKPEVNISNYTAEIYETAVDFGDAVSLDGVDDYVELPYTINPGSGNPFTVETWFKLNSTGTSIVLQQKNGTGTGRSWLFYHNDSETLGTFLGGSNLFTQNTVSKGVWHHAAVVYDGTTLYLYLDGKQEASNVRSLESSDGDFIVGNSKDFSSPWEGEVDELRIWNVARTQDEIQDNLTKKLNGTQNGLVAYYNFNEYSVDGTTINDVSENATFNNGDNNNFTDSIDFANAVSLDGTNDYVEIPNTDDLEFGTESFTVEAWVYDDPNSTDWWNNAVSKKGGNSTNGTDSGWTLRINGDDKPQFFLGDGTSRVDANSNTALREGEWYHLAGVVDRNTGEAYLYVNGELQPEATQSITGLGSINSGNSLKIGNWDALSSNNFWHGKVDEVRIWNTARTQAEIQENLYQKLEGSEGNLVAYYNFDSDSASGNTISDLTDNGNNGTLTNGNGNNIVESIELADAASFDGNDDYVESKLGNFPNSEITVEGWFKRFKIHDNQDSGTPLFSYATSDTNNNEVLLYESTNSNSIIVFIGNRDIDTSIEIPDENWHHWAVTWRSSDGQVLLYRDGEQVFSGNLSQGDAIENGGNFVLGQEQDAVGGGFDSNQTYAGKIDEVRIWNTVRTQAEIQANRYQKLNGTESGLVAYYNFDEDTVNETTIADIADIEGTLNNGDETNFIDSEIPTFKGHIDIELDQKVTNQPGIIVNYEIESDSTATQDEDFYNSQTDVSTTDNEPQTDSIFIAEGEDSARIYLTALPDAVVEGDENIKLTLLPDFNKALDLDGSNDYVEIANESNFDITNEITVEAWIKVDNFDKAWQAIVTKGDTNWRLHRYQSTNKIDFAISGIGNVFSDIEVNDGEWHHVAGVYDGTKLQIIVDGVSKEVSVSGSISNSAYKVRIGENAQQTGRNFDGQIDEVRIWDKARTETEIQDTRYATLNGDEANLVGYYNFNDDSVEGNIIADVSSNEALSFDGSNDYVNLNDSVVGLNQNDFTLEAWIKTTGTGEAIISKNDGDTDWERYEKAFYINGSGQVRFVGFGNDYIRGSKVVNDGEWHHVAVVWDHSSGTSGVGKIYVDGEDVTSSSGYTASNGYKDGDTLKIGRPNYGEAPNHFSGEMDEVRVWSTARSQSEIRSTLYSSLSGNENNLVAYYTFENGEAIDSTNNNNDGTINGATAVESDNENFLNNSGTLVTNNKVLSLDGNGDYVQLANESNFDITNTITVEAWIKVDSFTKTWQTIISKGDTSWRLSRNENTDNVHFALATGDSLKFVNSSTSVNDGEWHHIAGVYDGTSLKLYVDGVSNQTDASISIPTNNYNVLIGENQQSTGREFHGEIDEVRIWNTARSETEIQDYLNKKLNGDENGLVAYYTFEDSTANDQTSNGNNGSFNGNAGAATNNDVPIADNSTESLAYDPFATNGATYGIQSTQSAEITIQDSDNYAVDIVVANKFGEDLSNAANYVVVDESGNATFQVKLTSQPTQDATVSISTDSTTNNLTFTPNNWDTYQTITVSNLNIRNDANNTASNTVSINGGTYTNQTKQLSVVAFNYDYATILELTEGGAELELTPTVSISKTRDATEGNETESGVFTVKLDTPAPEGGLVIPFSVSSTATEGTDYNLYADTFTYNGESALSFDGVDDYVSIPDSSDIDFGTSQNFTVETWVKADSSQADLQFGDNSIIEKWSGNGAYPFVIRYLNGPGTIRAARYDGPSSGNNPGITSSTVINDGQFHHIAFVKNGDTLSLYIDGNLQGTANDTTTNSTQNTSPLYIGNRGESRNYFKGEVDEVRIWNKARTETEIRQNLYSKLEGTEDGLAAYYNFDDVTTTVPDLTGNGNDGTPFNINQGLSLDGVNDNVKIPHADELDFGTNSFTVEAWVYHDPNSGTDFRNVVSKKPQGGTVAGWTLRLDDNDTPAFFLADNSNTLFLKDRNFTITRGEWHHLAGVVDSQNGKVNLYVDGELVATGDTIGDISSGSSTDLAIGGWSSITGDYWQGKIDEVRIWNTARTEAEIKENLDKKLTATEDNLVAYYNFDDDSGTAITDSTTNSYDGTLNNGDGNNLVASTVGYPLTDWKTTKTPVVKIAEGETEATITVSKIDNEIAETAEEDVTVTLENWTNYNYTLNTDSQSATVDLIDDDTAGIEFAKLDTVGSVDNIAQEFIVSTAYNATTQQVGLTLNNGNNSYTFAQGTELTFDGGAVVTVDSQTTIAASGETLVKVTFTQDSATNEITTDEISEIELVNIELSSFATNDTNAVAIFNVSLAQAPTEDVTVTLTDANGSATGTVSFTASNWDTSQSVRMIVEEGTGESAFNLGVSTTTATQQDSNYGSRAFAVPISTETVATSLEFYNNTVVTSEVATIELEVTSDYANGNVGLKLASGAESYTLTAGTQLSFNDGAVVTVDTDTFLSTDDAGTSVAVTFTADSSSSAITTDETTEIELPGADSTKFAVRLSSQPTDTVTLDLAIGDATEGAFNGSTSNQNLTFTADNWDTYQEVTLYGVDDSEDDGNVEYSITTTATSNDLNYNGSTNSISVSNQDNESEVEEVDESELISSSITAELNVINSETSEDGSTTAELQIQLSEAAPTGGMVVEYEVLAGTANIGEVTSGNNPLSMVGFNQGVNPSFADVDNDGDFDAFITAVKTDLSASLVDDELVNNQTFFSTTYYENIGTADFPQYQVSATNPLNDAALTYSAPTFADIDNDGNLDAFIGNFDGTIQHYEYNSNSGQFEANSSVSAIDDESTNPIGDFSGSGDFGFQPAEPDPGISGISGISTNNNGSTASIPIPTPIDVGYGSSPVLVDIDGDNDFDLFVGSSSGGQVYYYENTGSQGDYSFEEITGNNNPLNEVDVYDGDESFDLENAGTDEINSFITFVVASGSVPTFGDVDGDGDYDALVGSGDGKLYYYLNVGDAQNPVFELQEDDTLIVNNINVGLVAQPTLVDIDNDGLTELFAGKRSGEVDFYEINNAGKVYIPEGETSANISFNAVPDLIAEDDETVEVKLIQNIDATVEVIGAYDANTRTIGLQLASNSSSDNSEFTLETGDVLNFSGGSQLTVVEDTVISANSTANVGVIVEYDENDNPLIPAVNETSIQSDYQTGDSSSATLTVTDDDTAKVLITSSEITVFDRAFKNYNQISSYTTSEDGSTETFYVSLETKPTDNVTVYFGVDNSQEGLLSDDNETNENLVKLVFSPENWDTSQAVTLSSLGDDIDDGDISYNIITTVISDDIKYNEDSVILKITEDFNYVANSTNTVSLLVDDLNILETEITAGTQLKFGNGMVLEVDSDTTLNNSTATTVNVNQVQAANQILKNTTALVDEDSSNLTDYTQLIVTKNYADGTLELQIDESSSVASVNLNSGQQLTFSNGTVFTVDNAVTLSNTDTTVVSGTINSNLLKVATTEVSTGSTAEVTTDYTDEDSGKTEIIVTAAYDQATGISLRINDTTASTVELVAGTQINFSNGAAVTLDEDVTLSTTASSVNVSGVGNQITTSFTETISPDISVTNTDNDDAGITVDKYDISSLEGYGNNFFNIKLNTKPVGEVTVTMNPVDASGDKDYNISLDDEFDGESYSVTFDETDWNLAKAVKVTAVDDYDVEYNHTSYIDFAVSSEEDSNYNTLTPSEEVIVKIEDNDLPVASVKTIAGAAEAGSPGYFVVTLDNPAPAGFDGTGIVVNYSIGGTVDVDGSGETDDLKPLNGWDSTNLTGSVRIAPGETRSPIIAFPIDDFKAEGVDLVVTGVNTSNISLQIDVDSFVTGNYSSSSETVELQLDSNVSGKTTILSQGTILNFANGAKATVKDSAIIGSDGVTTVAITLDSGTIISGQSVYQEITLPEGTKLSFENGNVVEVNASKAVSNQQGTEVSVNVVEGDIANISTSDVTNLQGESVTVSLDTGTEYTISDSSSATSASLILQDNDKPGVRVVEIDDTTVIEGGTSEFYISLLSQPEADVTISLAGVPTDRQIIVDQAYSSGATTIQLKVNDSEVNSLFLKAGTTLGSIEVSENTTIFSDKSTEVAISSLNNNISAGESFTYSYTELDFDRTYTFNSDNWYKLQTVTVKGVDDAVAETGDFHSSSATFTVTSTDPNYNQFEVAPQTINIIDRTFDSENTTESLIEGFFALQDGLDSVTLPIVGNLDGVAPSFIEDFIGDLVTEIKQTEYITAESLQDTFNNVLSGRFGIVEVEITDLSKDNIEFFLGIEDSFTESISIDGDLGLPALGIGVESNGSLDANFDYAIDLAFGIDTDDGFYINTEDTGFEVAASFGFSDDFSATGNLGFLQLDVANGDNVGGTGIDAEFVISMEDTNDSNGNDLQLTLSELNSLRKSDSLFDSIQYGFSGDAALDLDITTSVEGNTGFPSFGFNLSSELPLFNYSNSEDEEEVSGAEVVLNNFSDTSTTDTITVTVNHTDPDANSDIVLTKGTKLTFKDNNENEVGSVILQENETFSNGEQATLKAKLTNINSSDVNAVASLESGNFNLTFSDITLDLGGFVTDLMSPIISYVNELIEPFEPIIDVLQTEIEILETLSLVDMFDENGDGSATLIEVASYLATTFGGGNLKYQKFFDAVTGIIDLVDTINDLEDTISSGDNLGVDFGDYTLQNFAAAGSGDTSDIDTSDTVNSTNNLNSNVKNSAKNKGGSVKTKVKNFFSKLDDLGIGIPLLEDPLTAINLFLGQDVDLVTYDIPELDIEFNMRQEFPVPGTTIKGILEGGFSLYSDLVVGFDTYGLSQWEEADFDLAESYKILDGFYLSDLDPDTQVDVDELTLNATIAAGVSASAVVAKAEVTGGIRGTAGLDIIDGGEFTGTSDGKLRGSEVLEADSLFDLFSLSGSLDAFVKALVKVGIDLGFYEIMETVWEKEFSVTLFEFELGGSSGTVSQSYIEGATVFFDANLNGILEEGEPVTTSNADGSYNLEIPLLFFDTNDNGKIDPEEGRIVTEGGTDSSSGVEIETPLIAPYGAKMVTPLTTLKQKLIEDGSTPEEAEQLIKEALEIPKDIKLEEFDALDAMSKGDERGTKVYKAHVQIQSLFAQTSEYIKGFGKNELVDEKRPIPEQAIDAIAKGIGKRKGKPPINFSDSAELEELIKEPLEGKFKPKPSQRPQRLPESFGILTKTMASGNREIDEVFKGVPPKDILAKVAPVKKETQDKLPKELRKLAGGARREDITDLLERVPEAEQFLLKEQSQPDGQQPPTNGGEKPDNKNPLPVINSEDDTIIPISPKKPKKLAKGKRPRNLLELDGDDLTDTKIKFSLSSKNLPKGRIHEIAIFTTEDEEGTINGINPEDAGYKEAALNKARSIFSILPDDFIANPKRIMKGFADKNIGFLLIKNGTVDSARRGRTPLDSVLLGTETQGDGFRGMQISEKGDNSFRLSFEDEMGDADFTDIVIDAELTDETPEIGTDIQGESEGEMIDLREYAGKQIQIQAPIVREESAYENVVGFYVVEDKNGAVRDPLTGDLINPGEEGYIKAALRNSQNNAFQMGEKGLGGNKQIKGGHIFAPFAIADGTLEEVLDDNPNNDPQVYFAHIGANTDGVDHIRNLGGNTWGVEDMLGGGDMDFNDIVFKLDVTVRQI